MSKEKSREDAVEMVNNSEGFLVFTTEVIDGDTYELAVVMEDMTILDLAQGIDWILQTYPEVIKHTIFGAGSIDDSPSLMSMN